MYKGSYIALSGASLKQRQLELISRDIANTSTAGYKKNSIAFKEHLFPGEGGAGSGTRAMSVVSAVNTDFSGGAEQKTGNPLDLALQGKGFFSLEGGRYTRNGSFMIDAEGYLAAKDGRRVLGQGGPIEIPKGNIEVNTNGDVMADGEVIDTLQIVDFEDDQALTRVGPDYMTNQSPADADAKVQQGYLEGSNVNPVSKMVEMIETLREFESYQKAIHAFDEASEKVVNEIGRI